MNAEINDRSVTGFVSGGALVLGGAVLTMQQLGLLRLVDLGRAWPLAVIVLALAALGATIKERRQRGWGLLMIGDWLLANTMTDWAYVQISVPLLLAGVGLFTIIRGLRDHVPKSGQNYYAAQQ
jgi:hypothetical protein